MRLVQTALRCYPQRWRSRHGAEAAELATLLMRDGMPARSIAWSYLKGAASTRLVLPPGRRLGAAVGALVAAACSLGVSLALVSSSAPASAASVVRLRITNRADAAGQLRTLLRAHHFGITVAQEPVSPSLVGSIITLGTGGASTGRGNVLNGITGPCSGGARGCVDGIVLPVHFTGAARIVVGRAARPGERYAAAAGIFRPGELLHCTGLLGEGVRQALPVLAGLHLKVAWDTGGGPAGRGRIAGGHYYVAGGTARSAVSISIRVTANKPANSTAGSRHGQSC
jgi:hypothetical protein